MYKAILTILILSASTAAQKKAPDSPCSKANLRAAMAENRLAAELAKEETGRAVRERLEQEVQNHKGRADSTEQRLSAEQANSTALANSVTEARHKVTELIEAVNHQDSVIAAQRLALAAKDDIIAQREAVILQQQQSINTLTVERDSALRKARSANARSILAILSAIGVAVFGATR